MLQNQIIMGQYILSAWNPFLLSLFCTETPGETPSTTTDQNYFYNYFSLFVEKTPKLRSVRSRLFCPETCHLLWRKLYSSAIQATKLKGLAKFFVSMPAALIWAFWNINWQAAAWSNKTIKGFEHQPQNQKQPFGTEPALLLCSRCLYRS